MRDLAALAYSDPPLLEFLVLVKSNVSVITCIWFTKSLPIQNLQRFSPIVFSRNFIAFTFKFKYEFYQVNFIYAVS